MIPSVSPLLSTSFEVTTQPSKTYELLYASDTIVGTCDGLDALKQAIYKILNTQRYDHNIYSTNYGIEISDLYGQATDFVSLELENRIEEALLQDDRINSVSDFEFLVSKGKITATFVVNTIYGEVETETVVNY